MKEIDFEIRIESLENDAKKLYTLIRPNIKIEEIKFKEFKEGFINSLVQLDDPISKDPLVFRSYNLKINSMNLMGNSNNEDKLNIDFSKYQNRKLELAAIKKASELGITVQLIATYSNGLVYKYVDGETSSFELYDEEVAAKTAIKMARFHQIDMGDLASKKTSVLRFIERKSESEKIRNVIDKLQKQLPFEEFQKVIPLYSELEDEYHRLYQIVHDNDAYGKICFCHNDLNKTNLLIVKETKEPVFIDFEWCETNFQMHDISYHLLNMAGSFLQYFNPEHIPNDDFIRKWLKAYYEESNRLAGVSMAEKEFDDLVENELKKVVVNMLLIRIQLLTRSFFMIERMGFCHETVKNYCLSIYNDFLKHRDEDLELLKAIKK